MLTVSLAAVIGLLHFVDGKVCISRLVEWVLACLVGSGSWFRPFHVSSSRAWLAWFGAIFDSSSEFWVLASSFGGRYGELLQ